MAVIYCEFPSVITKEMLEKNYGTVDKQGTKHIRNYGRTLKNGKGMNYIEAMYSTLPLTYPEIFQGRRQ